MSMNPFQPGAGLLPGYMGRRPAIERPLLDIVDRLRAGQRGPRLAYLYGPRGDGKTVLLRWLADQAKQKSGEFPIAQIRLLPEHLASSEMLVQRIGSVSSRSRQPFPRRLHCSYNLHKINKLTIILAAGSLSAVPLFFRSGRAWLGGRLEGYCMKPYKRPLTVRFLNHVSSPGKYYDGLRSNGLRFCVRPDGYKYWECRVMRGGRRRTFYLGAYSSVTLREAREAALAKVRELRGRCPGASSPSSAESLPAGSVVSPVTFAEAAAQLVAARSRGWSRPQHTTRRWMHTFEQHVFPLIGPMPVSAVGTDDIVRVLECLEAVPRGRQVVRAQLTAVFSWAIASRHRVDNPADPSVLSSLIVLKHSYAHHPALPHPCSRRTQTISSCRYQIGMNAWHSRLTSPNRRPKGSCGATVFDAANHTGTAVILSVTARTIQSLSSAACTLLVDAISAAATIMALSLRLVSLVFMVVCLAVPAEPLSASVGCV